MNIKEKRKMKEIIRGLVGDGFSGTQHQLAKILQVRGFKVTQPTVSRTMSQMGVMVETKNGRRRYRIKEDSGGGYKNALSDLVLSVSQNEYLIVIKTKPGSAMFIAGFIDHRCNENILGTIAGDDTIFVTPIKTSTIKATSDLISKTIFSEME